MKSIQSALHGGTAEVVAGVALPSGLLEGVSQTNRQTYRAAAPDSVKVSSATENIHLFICPDSAFNS